jgi:hypothetical protein
MAGDGLVTVSDRRSIVRIAVMMPYSVTRRQTSGEIELAEALGDYGELTHDNPGRLIVVALVPPEAAFYPPAVLSLIIEQGAAPAAHVIFELDLGILLHTHLDCRPPAPVPSKSRFFQAISAQK